MDFTLPVKKLTKTAKLPTRATDGSAGLDLYADQKIDISTGTSTGVRTGLSMAIPKGFMGLIKINSGTATKENVTENAGVVDSDFRGEVKVVIANISNDIKKVQRGDKIGQIVIVPCWMGEIKEVTELDNTQRGEKGFGEATEAAQIS